MKKLLSFAALFVFALLAVGCQGGPTVPDINLFILNGDESYIDTNESNQDNDTSNQDSGNTTEDNDDSSNHDNDNSDNSKS